MPFPHTHIAFFILIFGSVAVFMLVGSIRRAVDVKNVLFILLVGGFCALLPDVPFVFNLFNHSDVHTCIGFLPTHSLLFSTMGFAVAALLGFVVFRVRVRAFALGLIGLAASLSHLLDDLSGGSIVYLYPLSGRAASISDVRFLKAVPVSFEVSWFLVILFFFVILMLTYAGLSRLGFKFEYQGE